MSPFALFRRLAVLLPWLKARRAYLDNRIVDALAAHQPVINATSRPLDKAFHATLLILDHRSDEAKPLFRSAIEELERVGHGSSRQEYVLNYCRYYLALMEGSESDRFRTAERALTSRTLRRLLPLPPGTIFEKRS